MYEILCYRYNFYTIPTELKSIMHEAVWMYVSPSRNVLLPIVNKRLDFEALIFA